MILRSVRNVLICAVAAAAAVAVGLVAAPHVSAHPKLFPELALGLAGVVLLAVAVVMLDPAWILSIGLGLSIFSGDWHYLHLPGPLDRGVTFVGIAAVLLRPLLVKGAPRLEVRRIHWLLAFLAAYALASATLAGTLRQHAALFELLDRLGIEPFVLYLVAPAAFATQSQRRILLGTLAVIGAYLGLTAIFEKEGPHSLVFPRYILNPALGIHADRARGPFLEAGADGLAMFNSIVACVMLLAHRLRRGWKVALVLTILVCMLGIVLTLTRQVWVGAVAGALVAGVLSPKLRRWIPLVAVVLAAAVYGAIVVIPGLHASVRSRSSDQKSLWDRYNSDSAALRMIEAKPLFGFGWGTFPAKSPRYYHVARTYPLSSVPEVHNVSLSNAVEIGLFGFGMWLLAIVIAMIGPLTRRGPPELAPWKLATIAIAVAWFVQTNFAPVSYAYDNYIPWVFAAIAYGTRAARTGTRTDAPLLDAAVGGTSAPAPEPVTLAG